MYDKTTHETTSMRGQRMRWQPIRQQNMRRQRMRQQRMRRQRMKRQRIRLQPMRGQRMRQQRQLRLTIRHHRLDPPSPSPLALQWLLSPVPSPCCSCCSASQKFLFSASRVLLEAQITSTSFRVCYKIDFFQMRRRVIFPCMRHTVKRHTVKICEKCTNTGAP